MKKAKLKKTLEALLFVSSSPISSSQIAEAFGIREERMVRDVLEELKADCVAEDRGIRIMEIAGGWRITTSSELAPVLKKWFKGQRSRLSRAALETLSIVAYRQPVTRSEVEAIRGVNVEGALGTLLERGLARITGRKEAPGRPMLYGTTRLFLEHFGLNTLKDLPVLTEHQEQNAVEPKV